MKKITFFKIVAGAFLAAISISTSFAQTNLGAECGCPAVPAVAGTTRPAGVIDADAAGNMNNSQVWDCAHTWTLEQKIYVKSGQTLTIQPGTVVRGDTSNIAANATALIIERGGKIIADGTESCPIVFTSVLDPMNGTFPITNTGQWGGICILGRAVNNLVTTNTYGIGTGADGLGFIEGFSAASGRDIYGGGASPINNDNSGILRYVSVRYPGAIVSDANELNGISLGSVGSGTTIEHVEIVASADDGIEIFGGTVNLKYCSALFGDDDMIDYDLGWTGKGQFLFALAADSVTGVKSTDSGFEADGDDNAKAPALLSHPKFYNVTIIGNGHILPHADNTGPAAIMAKELVQGEFYNSIFANFRSGLHLATGRSATTGDAYDNWTNSGLGTGTADVPNSLLVKNNTFIGFGSEPARAFYITKGALTSGKNSTIAYKAATPASAADITQFTSTDGNSVVASIPGIDYNWAWNDPLIRNSYSSNPFHVTPNTNIISTITPPADGFFSVVNFRGAFDATKDSWLSTWAFAQALTLRQSNPTDLNADGITNSTDFLILVNKFGQISAK